MDTMSMEHLADLGDALTDHYTDALIEVNNAKAEHRTPAPAGGGEAEAAPVVDLMAALEASVAKAKEARGESTDPVLGWPAWTGRTAPSAECGGAVSGPARCPCGPGSRTGSPGTSARPECRARAERRAASRAW